MCVHIQKLEINKYIYIYRNITFIIKFKLTAGSTLITFIIHVNGREKRIEIKEMDPYNEEF